MFHRLPDISAGDTPLRFTYPFHYQAHPWCKIAAKRLQQNLCYQGFNRNHSGKMFGVLIVKNNKNKLGYLAAYSGNITAQIDQDYCVPPIYNLLDPTSFFLEGEKELTRINKYISTQEEASELKKAKEEYARLKIEMNEDIDRLKTLNKSNKAERDTRRNKGVESLNNDDLKTLQAQLIKESQRDKSQLNQLKKQWQTQLKETNTRLEVLNLEIKILKQERQAKSAALQQRLFDQYQLLNAKGEEKSLCNIFHETLGKQPPAAAGDCAAPRLLQYAYNHDMKPIAMAEFWWGKSPKTIIRKQGNYYPSCRGKCEPILGHMLQGLELDNNPIEQTCESTIDIIFEDQDLIVINKPAGLLSVKGKTNQTCVLDQLKTLRPSVITPMLVHRLDMATSGLLLIAKDENTYKHLQKQFLTRQVNKSYEAILDGIIDLESGKIQLPLRVDLDNRPQQMVCFELGKKALTQWRVIERMQGKTRVIFWPITGRTHQLRVHAAHPLGLSTPIVGDELYGTKAERLHLHAAHLEFTHPRTQKTMSYTSKAPF